MFNFFSKNKQSIPLYFNTDIHCHVVPGVDDGSPDIETSVKLVGALSEMGLNRIITTPHVTDVTFPNNAENLAQPFAQLVRAVTDAGIDVKLAMAAENRVDDLFAANYANNTLLVYPGKSILIENSFVQEPWSLEQTIFDLQTQGIRPILAHPERYLYYHRNRGHRYNELHRLVQFQVNVLSLSGYYGKEIRKAAEYLMENDMIDYLGTDCHGIRHIENIRQYLGSRDAVRHARALESRIGNDRDFPQ